MRGFAGNCNLEPAALAWRRADVVQFGRRPDTGALDVGIDGGAHPLALVARPALLVMPPSSGTCMSARRAGGVMVGRWRCRRFWVCAPDQPSSGLPAHPAHLVL